MSSSDIRQTVLYQEAESLYQAIRQPGTGLISDASEVHASTNGRHAVFAGTIVDELQGSLPTRICQIDLEAGTTRVLTFGPHTDRLPKYSPDGATIAFLSDRHQAGDFQLYLLDPATGAARSTPQVDGWVEYLHWSPDGKRIVLGVAGREADIAGGQGAVRGQRAARDAPSWMPVIDANDEDSRWRRAWVYELTSNRVRQVGPTEINLWEVVWCGNDALAAIASPGAGEGLWYSAKVHVIDLESGKAREVFRPKDQIGWPAASPSGKHLAVVEAVCSDRWIVAGDLRLVELATGTLRRVDTRGVDITHTEWRFDRHLLVAGHRGFDSVVGVYDLASDAFTEVWSSQDITTGGRYITVSGIGDSGDCVLIGESFTRSPEIALIRSGEYQTVKSFDLGYADQIKPLVEVERLIWKAPDGLEVQGWLLRPEGKGPHPLVMNIHGGPVWHHRSTWLGRSGVPTLMLIKKGFAVFYPNPRGSSGRGQEFARHVLGEMGGADTYDFLSGLDHLVAQGIADAKRLGVTGGSYGGFMTSWLITQDARFSAAVPVAPVTNMVSQHLISNIPHFDKLFLADHYTNPSGKYFTRSPVMHAHKVKTPTLNICGALDRCTPPEEAMQFHNALLENAVTSVMVTYPEEGHGIRKLPAAIDYTARVVDWFERHL